MDGIVKSRFNEQTANWLLLELGGQTTTEQQKNDVNQIIKIKGKCVIIWWPALLILFRGMENLIVLGQVQL